MTVVERERRIIHEINETHRFLKKAEKRYSDSIICLKMDIVENKELGNDISANKPWVDYCNEDKRRVAELKAHIERLNAMLTV